MQIPWSGDRCIVCLDKGPMTIEHIIPKCIGGKLWSQFLCQACNSFIGRAVEAEVRSDPSVRIAVRNLESRIPKLAKEIAENQGYVACGPGGKSRGRLRDGEFRVTSYQAADGSLIQPTPEARKSMKAMLTKSGMKPAFVGVALEGFDRAPENERVRVAQGLEATKWTIEAVELDLSGSPLMNTLVPVKVAFEFLACHLGESIYDEAPQLNELRAILLGGKDGNEAFRVERLSASRYEPFHGVCFEGNAPHARFQVRLFGWLTFRVHLLRVDAECDQYAYTHDLATGTEHLSRIGPLAA